MLRSIGILMVAASLLAACAPKTPPPAAGATSAPPVTELIRTDVAAGSGVPVTSGQTAVVHYTGWLYDPGAPEQKGAQFDSSRDRGQPFRFPIGAGRVIRGWDEGVAGMMVGGRRILIVPASKGYGDAGAGGGVIPPGATLLFDVELLAIEPAT